MALVLSPPSASALGICVNRAALRAPAAFLVNDAEALRISSEMPVIRMLRRSLGTRSSCSTLEIDRGFCSHRCVRRPPIWVFRVA
jgi:hypothetical protein